MHVSEGETSNSERGSNVEQGFTRWRPYMASVRRWWICGLFSTCCQSRRRHHDAVFLRCAQERAFACDDEPPDQLLVAQVAVIIVRSETERPLRLKEGKGGDLIALHAVIVTYAMIGPLPSWRTQNKFVVFSIVGRSNQSLFFISYCRALNIERGRAVPKTHTVPTSGVTYARY
jgi:hypothetical protein